ncbi:MAG: Mrp/NBP35 family ATP-binding protein [Pseudomonadota bacterium]
MADINQVRDALAKILLPSGKSLIDADMLRALSSEAGVVRFVIEAPSAEVAAQLGPFKEAAEAAVKQVAGVTSVSAVLTAHSGATPASKPPTSNAPPSLKIGQHPKPQSGPAKITGVDRILAVASGKGGVGKSTVSANLAVALARQGRSVGLLDADIYGPSQPRMMGASGRPASPDGKTIIPLKAHGVTIMSLGLMLGEDKAVVWRGPMLMGALQQMLTQTEWGELDVLIVDLPPGTGDVQLTLCQRSHVTGALVVSTPQDVALLDARRAIDMFNTLKTPILGLIENMSQFICPSCGHESHIFGHGGVALEAQKLGVPFLAELPLALDVRTGGDSGQPIALTDSASALPYAKLAERLILGGMA